MAVLGSRTGQEIDKYWSSTSTQEPISSKLKSAIQKDLQDAWHSHREEWPHMTIKIAWSDCDDHMRITLEDETGKFPRKRFDHPPQKQFEFPLNKTTAFYWFPSAQRTLTDGQGSGISLTVAAMLYEEWRRCYNNRPSLEFGHFLAHPVGITKTGPLTIQAVLAAHQALCTQATNFISDLQQQPEGEIDGYSAQNFNMLPTYKAIVLIIDRLEDWREFSDLDGFINLRHYAKVQTLLVARTGLDQHLSTPVSLESLKSRSYPLERPEFDAQYPDVVRVSLADAVKFIVDLEIQENPTVINLSVLETRLCPVVGGVLCLSPEQYSDLLIAEAEQHGYDQVRQTWLSVRRVQSTAVGEDFADLKPVLWRRKWRRE